LAEYDWWTRDFAHQKAPEGMVLTTANIASCLHSNHTELKLSPSHATPGSPPDQRKTTNLVINVYKPG